MLPPQERLSQQELQRRYDLVRSGMKKKGLEVLARLGHSLLWRREAIRATPTNWAEPFGGEVLIFPREGTPLFLARTGERALLRGKHYLGMEARTGSTAVHAADVLEKKDGVHACRYLRAENDACRILRTINQCATRCGVCRVRSDILMKHDG